VTLAKVESSRVQRERKVRGASGHSLLAYAFSPCNLLHRDFNGVEVIDKDLHALPSIHVTAGVNIDGTTSVFREGVNANV
jgi:hypothetical protein